LYGDLPARNRTSRSGRAIRPGPDSPLSSSSNQRSGLADLTRPLTLCDRPSTLTRRAKPPIWPKAAARRAGRLAAQIARYTG